MNIAIAADHAGYALKRELIPFLESLGHTVEDFGAREHEPSDDYPDVVIPTARAVASGAAERGIIIGASGQGEAMAANKVAGVRAAVFYGNAAPRQGNEKVGVVADVLEATRADNDANVLALGAAFLSFDEAKTAVERWLATPFSGEARHIRRIAKLEQV